MDLVFENNPQTCTALDLDCGTCVHQAAASVAVVCRDLDPAGAQQIFFQLYPSPGCRPMAQAFALAYGDLSNTAKPLVIFASAAA